MFDSQKVGVTCAWVRKRIVFYTLRLRLVCIILPLVMTWVMTNVIGAKRHAILSNTPELQGSSLVIGHRKSYAQNSRGVDCFFWPRPNNFLRVLYPKPFREKLKIPPTLNPILADGEKILSFDLALKTLARPSPINIIVSVFVVHKRGSLTLR